MNITLRRVKFHAFYILVKKSDVDCIIINVNLNLKRFGRFKQYESRSNADPFLGALVIMPNGIIKNSQSMNWALLSWCQWYTMRNHLQMKHFVYFKLLLHSIWRGFKLVTSTIAIYVTNTIVVYLILSNIEAKNYYKYNMHKTMA